MLYLIGGLPGMRKSSIIYPMLYKMLYNKKPVFGISTDIIRSITSYLLLNEVAGIGGPINIEGKSTFQLKGVLKINDLRKLGPVEGEDELAWVGTVGFIKRCYSENGLLVEGVAISPVGARDLQINEPRIKIRAAFVGYSKKMKFRNPDPKWTYGLGGLIYDEIARSDKLRKEVEELNLPNFKYFDLIECIPTDRRNQEFAQLELEDFIKNAGKITNYLLENEKS